MDTALFLKLIIPMFIAIILILVVKKFDFDKLAPWDFVFMFFAGPLWPIIFPALFVYLGIYMYNDKRS